jgi:hypothetical protein
MEIIEWCFDVDGGMRVGAVVGLFLADLRGWKADEKRICGDFEDFEDFFC